MEKNQTLAIIVVAILAIAAIGAGIVVFNNNNSSGDRDVVDSRDRVVTVPNDIKTILCINPCALQLVSWFDSVDKVSALDSKDDIIGDKTYTQIHKDLFSKLKTVTVSNVEEVIALNPTVVISSTPSVSDINNEQEKYGKPVYAVNADIEFGTDSWFEQIAKLGKLLKEERRATELINGVKSMISVIEEKTVTDVSGYACGMMYYRSWNFVKTTGDYLPFDYCGIKNVMPTNKAGNKQPYDTTIEEIVAKSIDYIFIDGSFASKTTDQMKGYISSTSLGNEPAIKNGNIYKTMVYKIWGTQWDNQLINCFFAAKTVNDAGYAWEFEDKANEVLQLFYKGTTLKYSDIAKGESSGGCGKVVL